MRPALTRASARRAPLVLIAAATPLGGLVRREPRVGIALTALAANALLLAGRL